MTYDPNLTSSTDYGDTEFAGAEFGASATSPTTGGAGHQGRTDQAKDAAKDVAGSAKEQGRHTAGVAGEEAKNVASEVTDQARDLLAELRTQVAEQTGTQKQRLVEALTSFTDELQQMAAAGGGTGTATELVRQVASRTQALRDQLDGNEPAALLEQGRGVARRRPGTFLLGALAAGVVAGRLTRGAKAASSSSSTQGRTTAVVPVATTPPVDLTVHDQPVFEPSAYEGGIAAPGTPTVPTSTQRPYGSDGL